jgi:hypothetical protein
MLGVGLMGKSRLLDSSSGVDIARPVGNGYWNGYGADAADVTGLTDGVGAGTTYGLET